MYSRSPKKPFTYIKQILLLPFLLLPCWVAGQQKETDLQKRRYYEEEEDSVLKRDIIGILKHTFHIKRGNVPKKSDNGKIYYSLIPVPTNIPGGGTALITSTNAAFYLGPRRSTFLSNVSFSPSFSFSGRFSFSFHSNLWLEGNQHNITGDMRFIVNPQYTWGLGKGVPDNEKQLLDNNYVRFYQTFMRKIGPRLLAGLGYHLDWHYSIELKNNDSMYLPTFVKYRYGTEPGSHSLSSGISLNLLKDSRQNSINPQSGYYANAVLRLNPRFLGSDDYWSSLYVDYRKYFHFGPSWQQHVLALWGYYWTVLGNKTPYLDLPSIGWEPNNRSGRGIEQNRYRGKGLFNLEAEYRRDITADGLLGFTVFVNMNTVTQPDKYRFTGFHPAAGAGLRIKFNKRSNTNIALDFGISRHDRIFYINLGEAF
ncbi:BamA/TamA family outer membrane protein [Chitinophaga japonensis]|uniref:Surface antigen-like protein n=1 Tax=Chitinophaga japonensis TaxID=104662 RepID=A0A562STL3_CHIJA|nr:BamA/TamA family outer membrane protein [Chitinophaga japonensis]TWI84090.1 surface antigen-like protein [Chitinophaga japonensis]